MRRAVFSIFGLALSLGLLLTLASLWQANVLVHNPQDEHKLPLKNPRDFGMEFQDVLAASVDGFLLNGWFIPGENDALIMMQHGYKYNRQGLLEEASMMHEAGFNVLITSVRSHDYNKGELITFGINEQQDLAAWYDLATNELPVNPSKIGMLGESLGGSMSIQYAVTNPSVRAVVLHSAFSSLQDTINTSVTYFTGLPAFPFAPMITFWAELILGFSVDQVDATRWISDFSPRPVLIIHSTTDLVISQKSGELLYQSASEPKTLWQESGIEHVGFDKARADDFSQKVGEFFTNALKPSFPKPGAAKSKWE